MGTGKTFCVLPWVHTFIGNDGKSRLCCVAQGKTDVITNVKELVNNDYFNKSRLQMLNDEMPDACYEYCYKLEKNGGTSKRQEQNTMYYNGNSGRDGPEAHVYTYEEAVKDTNTDGTIDIKPLNMRFDIGTTCDLACVHCSSTFSTKWYELNNAMYGDSMIPEKFNWLDNKELINGIIPMIKSANIVKFSGGEPLLNKQHKVLLQAIIDNNPGMHLTYHTNSANFTEEYIDLWNKLDGYISLAISMDGIKDKLEYFRWPVNWDNILKNWEMLHKLKHGAKVTVVYSLNLFNVMHVKDDIEFLRNEMPYPLYKGHPVAYNFVWKPAFMHGGLLPDKIKDTIKTDYNNHTLQAYLKGEKYDAAKIKKFKEYVGRLDKARNTNFAETYPELMNAIT
jgi:organic radical activating enzyme